MTLRGLVGENLVNRKINHLKGSLSGHVSGFLNEKHKDWSECINESELNISTPKELMVETTENNCMNGKKIFIKNESCFKSFAQQGVHVKTCILLCHVLFSPLICYLWTQADHCGELLTLEKPVDSLYVHTALLVNKTVVIFWKRTNILFGIP